MQKKRAHQPLASIRPCTLPLSGLGRREGGSSLDGVSCLSFTLAQMPPADPWGPPRRAARTRGPGQPNAIGPGLTLTPNP